MAELLLVCNSLAGGGIARVVTTLANAWSDRGRDVTILTIHGGETFYHLEPGVRYISLLEPSTETAVRGVLHKIMMPARYASRRLLEPARRHLWARILLRLFTGFDAVLVRLGSFSIRRALVFGLRHLFKADRAHTIVAFGASMGILAILAARGLDKRIIVSERNDPALQDIGRPWQQLRPRLYNRAHVVTANSRGALRTLSGYVDAAKLAYAPNPICRPRRETETANRPRGAFILNVARLDPQKAHDVLLESYARSTGHIPESRLVILGSGALEPDLKVSAQKLGISNRLEWGGHVRAPYAFYEAARMFVLPSRHEGMPNALLEAMHAGLPVIVSDASPGPLELVDHDITGLVVPVDEPVALADAIVRLWNDAALRTRLAKNARERVKEFHLPAALSTWDRILTHDSQWPAFSRRRKPVSLAMRASA